MTKRAVHTAYVALGASIVFGVTGQLLMKWAAINAAGYGSFLPAVGKTTLALAVYALGVVNWIYALRSVNLSVAYPLSSLNYVGIFIGSYFLFGEHISTQRFLGVALIFCGVLLIVLRSPASRGRTPV
jgi:multidrug transporter EmrE-like cation transporter